MFLAIEMTSMLVGESALPEQQAAIRAAIEASRGVERVIHMRTLHIGPDELLVAAKIAVTATSTAAEVGAIIDGAEQRLRAAMPMAAVDLPGAATSPALTSRCPAGRFPTE